jgi:16S rRNA (guanine527-N7)-methyltransferase
VLDAAALSRVLPEVARLVDLGSGAGFPGLPLSVLRPECEVLLVEAREKRHHFQRAAVRRLGLENARPLRGRAEALEPIPSPLVVAQAMAAPAAVLRSARAWVEPGGRIAIPGGGGFAGPIPPPDWIAEADLLDYVVPCGGPARRLWLGRSRS